MDTFGVAGFAQLARTPDELLYGGVARVCGRGPAVPKRDWATPALFNHSAVSGHVKIAMNFQYANGLLTTETRVLGADARARRRFAAYWFIIRPGSGLIRRIWLRAIRPAALRSPPRAAEAENARHTRPGERRARVH